MTTFLANPKTYYGEEITLPYCSLSCRESASLNGAWTAVLWQSSSYEFDEKCSRCGELIPASATPDCATFASVAP